MPRFTRWLLLAVAGTLAIVFLNGCKSPGVGLHYTPQKNVAPVAGADRVPIKITVEDVRLDKSIGAVQSDNYVNGFWFVYSTNDVVAVLRNSIADELVHRGFKVSDNGVNLLVGLNTIDGNNDGIGKIAISVQIVRSDGTIGYSRLITGKGNSNFLAHIRDEKIIIVALDRALEKCLGQLFADPSFIDALLATPAGHENVGKQAAASWP